MPRSANEKRERSGKSKKSSKQKPKSTSSAEEDDEKSIHIRLCPVAKEIGIVRDDSYHSEGSTISLTPSVHRHNRYGTSPFIDEMYNEDYMRKNGWCNNDGAPWNSCCPRDELALLKKGVVSRDCKRSTYANEKLSKTSSKSSSRPHTPSFKESADKFSTRSSRSLSKVKSSSSKDNIGTLIMDVGTAGDYGKLVYTVTNDGRTYELQTEKNSIVLEFSKKHAYLVSSCK